MARALRCLLLIAGIIIGLIAFSGWLSPEVARAGTGGCHYSQLGSPSATASISFNAAYTDNATWKVTFNIAVPTSWPLAVDLDRDHDDAPFERALACLFPPTQASNPPDSYSISVAAAYADIEVTYSDDIESQGADVPKPWSVNPTGQGLSVKFSPDKQQMAFDWTDTTVSATGFRIVDPEPVPDLEESRSKLEWTSRPGNGSALPAFEVFPSRLVRASIDLSQNDLSYTPADAEQVPFLVGLVTALYIRRRRQKRAHFYDRGYMRLQTLCLSAAIFSLVQLLLDFAFEANPAFLIGPNVLLGIQLTMAPVAAYFLVWPDLGRIAKSLLGVLICTFCCYEIHKIITFYNFPFFEILNEHSPADKLSECFATSLGLFAIPQSVGSFLLLQESRRKFAPFLAAIAVISATSLAFFSDFSFDAAYFPLFIDYAVPFGVIAAIARSGGSTSRWALGALDRLLLALALGLGALVTMSQYYLGLRIGLVGPLVFLTACVLLPLWQKHSLVARCAAVLDHRNPGELSQLQRRLFVSARELEDVTKELKALDGVPLTQDQAMRRNTLKDRSQELHCWPKDEPDAPTDRPRGNFFARAMSRFRPSPDQPVSPSVEFPEPAGPADMALSLGPECDPVANLRWTWRRALLLASVPVCYYGIRGNPGDYSPSDLSYYAELANSLAAQLTLWILPLLVLAVVWSSLAGRRGPARGLQIWLIVAVPLVCHAILNEELDQSNTLLPIMQAALWLIMLVLLGLWLDLATLRKHRKQTSSVTLFRGYIRFNRVVTTVTLLIPLATASLTVWNQIHNGALHQKPTTVQSPARPGTSPSASPKPSPSPSSPGHRSSHKK